MSTRSRARREVQRAQAAAPDLPPTGGRRVLFLGDTAGTGFGTVTRDLALAMVRRGMDVRILSMNEDAGFHIDPAWPRELVARTILLGMDDGWLGGASSGKEALGVVAKAMGIFAGTTIPGWRPEVVLIVGDHASMEMSPWSRELLPPDLPAWAYTPIEGVDLPPSWGKLWGRVKPIAMTQFGAEQIAKVTGEVPPVVYHGIDPDSFWEVSPSRPLELNLGKGKTVRLASKHDCRVFLGWPTAATILFRADRLMPRKTFPAMFRQLAPVLARHQDVLLFLHCRTIDQGGNMWHEVSKYPDFIRDRIGSTGFHDKDGGAPRQVLMAMYNAADLYVSTSAEGFGLTVAESLACGTPAVALNYSSLPEVVGPAGILVDDFALMDNVYSYFWAMPKGHGFQEAVERLVQDPTERRRLGKLGPIHVAQFDWSSAAAQMDAILSGEPAPAPSVPARRRLAALGLVGG